MTLRITDPHALAAFQRRVARSQKQAIGPAGYWCRYCGEYQSIRTPAQVRKAKQHSKRHQELGHTPAPTPAEGGGIFAPLNPDQKLSRKAPRQRPVRKVAYEFEDFEDGCPVCGREDFLSAGEDSAGREAVHCMNCDVGAAEVGFRGGRQAKAANFTPGTEVTWESEAEGVQLGVVLSGPPSSWGDAMHDIINIDGYVPVRRYSDNETTVVRPDLISLAKRKTALVWEPKNVGSHAGFQAEVDGPGGGWTEYYVWGVPETYVLNADAPWAKVYEAGWWATAAVFAPSGLGSDLDELGPFATRGQAEDEIMRRFPVGGSVVQSSRKHAFDDDYDDDLVTVIEALPYGMMDTIIQFRAIDSDGNEVTIAADHRMAGPILQALSEGDEPMAAVPSYMRMGSKRRHAGTNPDDQAGTAESNLPTPETNPEVAWPWELDETKAEADRRKVRPTARRKAGRRRTSTRKVASDEPENIQLARKVLAEGFYAGGEQLDAFSASAIVQVYEALSPAQAEKFGNFDLVTMVETAFKVINKARASKEQPWN